MTPERLTEIKERAEAATPGPWGWAALRVGTPGTTFGLDAANGTRILAPEWCNDGTAELDIATEADASFIPHTRDDVPALVAEVERARRLLLWLSSAYLDALTSLRDEGCEPTQWGKHREMERIAITIAESAPTGEPFTPEQMQALEAWAAEVTL